MNYIDIFLRPFYHSGYILKRILINGRVERACNAAFICQHTGVFISQLAQFNFILRSLTPDSQLLEREAVGIDDRFHPAFFNFTYYFKNPGM